MKREVFVSYATPDRAVAMKLVDELESRGITCWVAPRDVPGGTKYAEIILKALADAEVFLLLFSEHSNASEHVQREVERTLNLAKKIMPVRLADVAPSGAMDYYLATLHWIDVFDGNREGAFEETAHAVAKNLGKPLADKVDPDAASAADDTKADWSAAPVPSQQAEGEDSAKLSRKSLLIGGAVLAVVAVIAVVALGPDEATDKGDGGTGVGEAGDDAGGSDAGNGKGNPPPPPPPDPLAVALAEAGQAWSAGDLAATVAAWTAVIQLPNGVATRERIGEAGVSQLREVVSKAAEQSEAEVDIDFETLDSWRPLVEFSGQLGLDGLAPQRQRFELVHTIAEAESHWQGGQRDQVAKSLASLAAGGSDNLPASAEGEGNAAGRRLGGLLGEIVDAAKDGRLGSSQVLGKEWVPALGLAADRGNAKAMGMLATLAWESGDQETAAARLAEFEVATRGAESLDPAVAELVGEIVGEARKGGDAMLSQRWEPVYELANTHQLPFSLELLAATIYRRDPEAAGGLYRQYYDEAVNEASVQERMKLCGKMLGLFDRGEEEEYYRGEAQRACEKALQLDAELSEQPSSDEVGVLRNLADAGISAAQYIMGDLLTKGRDVEVELEAAFDYFQKAAEGGFVRAKYAVAECYYHGSGTEKDTGKTRQVLEGLSDAELDEVPEALVLLADVAELGEEQDAVYARARLALEAEVEAGNSIRYGTSLGFLLLEGKGGEPDVERGYALLSERAEQGDSRAETLVGFILAIDEPKAIGWRKELGIEKDAEKGIELIKEAARSGHPNAVEWCRANNENFDEDK